VRAVQLREKDLETRELLRMAYLLKELTVRYSAKLFINDRVDIALAVNAEGVHLGGAGMPAYAARKAAGEGMLIGVSAHSLEEAIKAEAEGADFITLGPIFETPSKMKYGKPLGPDLLREARGKISIPVFAIGGIKQERVGTVLTCGASGIALISAILGSENIKSNTEEFMRLLK
jgi:thiamine-phosphate pyrophosphorylase